MKRIFLTLPLLLLLAVLPACVKPAGNVYSSSAFDAVLPDSFERVKNVDIVCFAPYGDPLRSSSITFYETELNWYFDTFTEEEYESALQALSGYESLLLKELRSCTVDGFDAKRIACEVTMEQGTYDLIVYAIQGEQTYFFTLLNRDTDAYPELFDQMMKTLDLKETNR